MAKADIDDKFENQDFNLFEALDAIDKKDYNYYNNLTDEQKKKFSSYMMLMWTSAVKSDKVSTYYTLSTEYHANKHYFNEKIQNHPELQWMMLCASSPGIGKQFHQYIPHLNPKINQFKIKVKSKDIKDYFAKIYKNADNATITDICNVFVDDQNHKYKIADMYPNMKLSDIEVLSKFITDDELKLYDSYSGN